MGVEVGSIVAALVGTRVNAFTGAFVGEGVTKVVVGDEVTGAFVGAGVTEACVGAGVTGACVGKGVTGACVGEGVTGAFVGEGVIGACVGAGVTGACVGEEVTGACVGEGVTGACVGAREGLEVTGTFAVGGGVASTTVGGGVTITDGAKLGDLDDFEPISGRVLTGDGANVASVPRNLRARTRAVASPVAMSASMVVLVKQSISSSTPVQTERYLKTTS